VAVLVAALFIGLTISLDRASDPLAAQISALAGR
jgi:hypothetical protein